MAEKDILRWVGHFVGLLKKAGPEVLIYYLSTPVDNALALNCAIYSRLHNVVGRISVDFPGKCL